MSKIFSDDFMVNTYTDNPNNAFFLNSMEATKNATIPDTNITDMDPNSMHGSVLNKLDKMRSVAVLKLFPIPQSQLELLKYLENLQISQNFRSCKQFPILSSMQREHII